MFSIKSHLIVCAVALVVGLGAGYSIRGEKAELDRLESVRVALEAENKNLIRQLEVEHEYQQAAQAVAEKTQMDLEELEDRYADAVNELNGLQLQQLSYTSDDTSALREDSESAEPVQTGTGKCTGENKAEFQGLYEAQLKIAKDCDITASYYNRLLELYHSIEQNQQ